MKKIITILLCGFLISGCTAAKKAESKEGEETEDIEITASPTAVSAVTPTPKPSPTPTATPKTTAVPAKTATPAPTARPVEKAVATPEPQKEYYEEPAYVEPEPEYTEPVWEEPVYYEEPVQEAPTYNDGSVASMYNGQYPGTSCEGVAGLYLGGDMSYLLASYGYQVWDPVPGDVIAYFDGGWNYRHTAVFLGNGQALHGSYNADKSAQVASMYIGGYPNLCYYRIGGDTCYTQFLNDIAHANGGRAGWLEGITFPLG